MSKFEFLRDIEVINESKVFQSPSNINKFTYRDILDYTFLYLLIFQILRDEPELADEIKNYIQMAMLHSQNFDYFKRSTNDFYHFMHIIFGKYNDDALDSLKSSDDKSLLMQKINKSVLSDIKNYLNNIRFDRLRNDAVENRFFLKLESDLLVTNSNFRSIRRLVRDWNKRDYKERSVVISKILLELRTKLFKSEMLPLLDKLADKFRYELPVKEEKKEASPLKVESKLEMAKQKVLNEKFQKELKNKEALELVLQNCSNAVKDFISTGKCLTRVRGKFATSDAALSHIRLTDQPELYKGSAPDKRTPANTAAPIDDIYHEWSEEKGLIVNRRNSIFCTIKHLDRTLLYELNTYIIFPYDDAKQFGFKGVDDFTAAVNTDIFKNGGFKTLEFNNLLKEVIYNFLNNFEKFDNIRDAIIRDEVLVHGDYIAIKISDHNEILLKTIFGEYGYHFNKNESLTEMYQSNLSDVDNSKLIKVLKEQCSDVISFMNTHKMYLRRRINLYSGKSKNPSASVFKGKTESGREPVDSGKGFHNLFNEYAAFKGFKVDRGNSTFARSAKLHSSPDLTFSPNSSAYIIFPFNSANILYSNNVYDLASEQADLQNYLDDNLDSSILRKFDFYELSEKIHKNYPDLSSLELDEKEMLQLKNALLRFFDQFDWNTDLKNLKESYSKRPEILISGEYIAVAENNTKLISEIYSELLDASELSSEVPGNGLPNESLNESFQQSLEDVDNQEIVDMIKSNCKNIITWMTKNNAFLYRNRAWNTNPEKWPKTRNSMVFKGKTKEKRKPIDVSIGFQNLFDWFLDQKGIDTKRSNSTFCRAHKLKGTPERNNFGGASFMIFPYDSASYLFNENIPDFYLFRNRFIDHLANDLDPILNKDSDAYSSDSLKNIAVNVYKNYPNLDYSEELIEIIHKLTYKIFDKEIGADWETDIMNLVVAFDPEVLVHGEYIGVHTSNLDLVEKIYREILGIGRKEIDRKTFNKMLEILRRYAKATLEARKISLDPNGIDIVGDEYDVFEKLQKQKFAANEEFYDILKKHNIKIFKDSLMKYSVFEFHNPIKFLTNILDSNDIYYPNPFDESLNEDISKEDLTWIKDNFDIEDLEKLIKVWPKIVKECSNSLEIFKRNGFLYRGRQNAGFIGKFKSRSNRKPSSISIDDQTIIDNVFKKKEFKALRRNSVFSSTKKSEAKNYALSLRSRVYLLIPTDNANILFSNDINDLYFFVGVLGRDPKKTIEDFKWSDNLSELDFSEDVEVLVNGYYYLIEHESEIIIKNLLSGKWQLNNLKKLLKEMKQEQLNESVSKSKHYKKELDYPNEKIIIGDKSLNESKLHESVNSELLDIWPELKKNCRVILNYYKQTGNYLFRGTNYRDLIRKVETRSNRTPLAISPKSQKEIDRFLEQKGFEALRHNSTFASTSLKVAKSYSTRSHNFGTYIVIPFDDANYTFSNDIEDLYHVIANDYEGDTPLNEFLDNYEWSNNLKDLKNEVEVLISGKAYLINYILLKDLEELNNKENLNESVSKSKPYKKELDYPNEKIIKFARKKCSKAIKAMNENDFYLVRDRHYLANNSEFGKRFYIGDKSKANRTPIDTVSKIQNMFDDYLESKGFKVKRSKAIFANKSAFGPIFKAQMLSRSEKTELYLILPFDDAEILYGIGANDFTSKFNRYFFNTFGTIVPDKIRSIANKQPDAIIEIFDKFDWHSDYSHIDQHNGEVAITGKYLAIKMTTENIPVVSELFNINISLEEAGVGKIVKDVNTTKDVGTDEVRKQAKKWGFKLDKDNNPPKLR